MSDLKHRSSLVEALLDAAEEMGLNVGDLNGATSTGFMEVQTTTHHGARHSADRLLHGKPNLKLVLYTRVTKVGKVACH